MPMLRHMLNSGPTSAACGNMAIARASDSSSLLAREVQPGDGVGREHREDDRRARWRSAQMPIELRSAAGEQRLSLKTWRVVAPASSASGRNCGLPDTMSDGGLNDSDDHPQQREERVDDDRRCRRRSTSDWSSRCSSSSPLDLRQVGLEALDEDNAITTTVRNSSTETAEPSPRFTSVTFWR